MFYFVDQILELEPGRRALGVKHVTHEDVFVQTKASGGPILLSCIIGEALGQLGAWSAMAAREFAVRPVAGVVGEVAITGEAVVGSRILLDTTIDSMTDDAIVYHAAASVDGKIVLRLEDALGPLLPMEHFNDPHEVRERFAGLQGPAQSVDAERFTEGTTRPFDP